MATLFCPLLGLCNAGALASWYVQYRGLIGRQGITPAVEVVERYRAAFGLDVNGNGSGNNAGKKSNERAAAGSSGAAGGADALDDDEDDITLASVLADRRRAKQSLVPKWKRALTAINKYPTIFLPIGASDAAIKAVFAMGFLSCVMLLVTTLPSFAALTFALVYLSFTNVGQPWLGLQFESLLIESNTAFALTYLFSGYSRLSAGVWVYALRWLVFRLMAGAGAGKLGGGDTAWRDGSAMKYHYESQPLPNVLSRTAHGAPAWWHSIETYLTYGPEGLIPLLTFWSSSPKIRWLGFAATVGFNLVIAATGNYGHLHVLTIAIATSLVIRTDCSTAGALAAAAAGGECRVGWTGRVLEWLTYRLPSLHVACPLPPSNITGKLLAHGTAIIPWVVLAVYVAVTFVPFALNFQGLIEVNLAVPGWDRLTVAWASVQQWHVAGLYNLFAHMTRSRWELQLEGTADGGMTWHEFGYRAKPGPDLDAVPRVLWPGHIPRLDWRMWFLPISTQRLMKIGLHPLQIKIGKEGFYRKFEEKVLLGSRDVLDLLVVPPALRGRKLDAVRTLIYAYHFSEGRRRQGQSGQQAAVEPAPTSGAADAASTGTGEAPEAATVQPVQQQQQPQKYGPQWEEGMWWKRKFVAAYDMVGQDELPAWMAEPSLTAGPSGGEVQQPSTTQQTHGERTTESQQQATGASSHVSLRPSIISLMRRVKAAREQRREQGVAASMSAGGGSAAAPASSSGAASDNDQRAAPEASAASEQKPEQRSSSHVTEVRRRHIAGSSTAAGVGIAAPPVGRQSSTASAQYSSSSSAPGSAAAGQDGMVPLPLLGQDLHDVMSELEDF